MKNSLLTNDFRYGYYTSPVFQMLGAGSRQSDSLDGSGRLVYQRVIWFSCLLLIKVLAGTQLTVLSFSQRGVVTAASRVDFYVQVNLHLRLETKKKGGRILMVS